MEHKEIAKELLSRIGGSENVIDISHCTTRLRFNVKDDTKIDIASIEELEHVQGTFFRYGLFQIIFGAGTVNKIYKEMLQLCEPAPIEKEIEPQSRMNHFTRFAKTLSDIFVPIIPAMVASGLIKGLIGVLKEFGLSAADVPAMKMLDIFSSSAFIILPVLLGFSAAKQFGANPYLGAVIGGILTHPDLLDPSLLGSKALPTVNVFGLEVPLIGYQETVIPVLLSVYIMSSIEKLLKKIVPCSLDLLVIPFVTVMVTGFAALFIMGPVSLFIGHLMSECLGFVYQYAGPVAGLLFGGLYSLLVLSGLHHSFYVIEASLLADPEYGVNFLLPIWSMANVAQGGAGLAAFVKTKNADIKKIAIPASLTAFLGIAEPVMFGVNLKYLRPFIGAAIGGALGGAYVTFVHVAANSYGLTGIPMISIILPLGTANLVHYLIGFAIAAVSAFVATLCLGLKEEKE
ncbi:PTS system sucrose-specific transporter subunits IIBC [Bacillus glycinifermentans]|uniref:PTS sucrose transporter subunit IIBC n=1 Tax=Bacillus glycinifermentans TaxID=1664069 RepID=A0A0J6ENM8_9BACI|nr:sucrose-specific PTS transporter subunit IIBC [Bacillus glycinifermentans]ATH94748.1 PTS sucrose transporter subunit IIBC [Bacillus glycinifermentans]KMM58865.1 PTS system sucrose-specific transporter subunits IIBC [Bacillus glycinifermentans]KRT92032.1 PTS sucrose transporter subunit IIBC [Bacillus glycinifermentans]MEC0486477.1 sucrose-specific PTS transporter subunit IIBC [Bacillus glycinifermentans]MEC0494126.1 sucrose-specific PTS transporter subunit IIBC [Bacillus glycinifermentans]